MLAGQPGREDFEALRRAVFASPGLNRVVAHADSAAGAPELAGLVEGTRRAATARAAAYVCEGFCVPRPGYRPRGPARAPRRMTTGRP